MNRGRKLNPNKCNADDCTRRAKAKGLCFKHYQRQRKLVGQPCQVDFCGAPVTARGMCHMHYARQFRHGDTDSLIPNYGIGIIVHKQGYVMRWQPEAGRHRMEHIIVAEQALGRSLPPGAVVHHVDKDVTNNTPTNLVICPDQSYHMLIHKRMRELETLGYCVSTE